MKCVHDRVKYLQNIVQQQQNNVVYLFTFFFVKIINIMFA